MQKQRAWAGWYYVPTPNLAAALREAREMAHRDHPATPVASMMTPTIRKTEHGTKVHVIGRNS